MSVWSGGCAVSGPARVPDTNGALGQVVQQLALQHRELAGGLHDLEAVPIDHRDPGGVVAAVLQAAETFQQQSGSLARSDVANDTTHRVDLSPSIHGRPPRELGRRPQSVLRRSVVELARFQTV